jgi:hypothetical protein
MLTKIGTTGDTCTISRRADLARLTLSEAIAILYSECVSKKGQQLTFIMAQDAIGDHTMNFASRGSSSRSRLPPIPAPNPAAGAKTVYTFVSDGSAYHPASVQR